MAPITRLRVGLFGVAFHLSMAALVVTLNAMRGASFGRDFWTVTLPAILVSALVIYLLVVWPYAARRVRRRGVVLFDSAVGMLAECAIAVLVSFLLAVVNAGPALRAGPLTYAGAVAENTLLGLLWALADFLLQILIVGNAAGVAGWYVIERLEARRTRR